MSMYACCAPGVVKHFSFEFSNSLPEYNRYIKHTNHTHKKKEVREELNYSLYSFQIIARHSEILSIQSGLRLYDPS